MKPSQLFIRDAVLGDNPNRNPDDIKTDVEYERLCAILMNPKAWQSVGKRRGWRSTKYPNGQDEWYHKSQQFFSMTMLRKTIDEALASL